MPRNPLRADLLIERARNGLGEDLFADGVGGRFDLEEPFVIVSQHPVTTEYGDGNTQITETLMALHEVGVPAVVLWPNADAGSEDVARGMRQFRERSDDSRIHFFKNLPTDVYIATNYVMLPSRGTRNVALIHDIGRLTKPHLYNKRQVMRFRFMVRRCSRYADTIVTPTEAVASEIVELGLASQDRIRVVPWFVREFPAGENARSRPVSPVCLPTTRPDVP